MPRPAGVECDFSNGVIIHNPQVAEKYRNMLETVGGTDYDGDRSRQDSALITALLQVGYAASDVYITFTQSERGKDALRRKEGHYPDYLERTISNALSYIKQQERPTFEVDFSGKSVHGNRVTSLKDVTITSVKWVWPGYIPAGKLTILAGDPGMGKSTIAIDLCSRISRGSRMPNSTDPGITGHCIYASSEDCSSDTLGPRFYAAQANRDRIDFIEEVGDEQEVAYLTFPRDFDFLHNRMKDNGCRLLVLDPLSAFIDSKLDIYKEHDVRTILFRLGKIAEDTGAAILVLAHLTKKEEASTLYRITNSIGFVAASRSAMAVTKTPTGDKVLYLLKYNLTRADLAPPLKYETKSINRTRTDSEWEGEETIHSSGIQWRGPTKFDPSSDVVHDNPESETVDFLKQMFDGVNEVDQKMLTKEARSCGIPWKYVASMRLKQGIERELRNGNWFWVKNGWNT